MPLTTRALLVAAAAAAAACTRSSRAVVVASKNFDESILLGEIIAQRLERAGVPVVRRLNLGGTFECHRALVAGDIDLYVEYTGTAYAAILNFGSNGDRRRVRGAVDSAYRERWDLEWTEALGFDNSFTLLIRGELQRKLGVTTISQAVRAARQWEASFGPEFAGRPDGYAGLRSRYGLLFVASPRVVPLDLAYRALVENRVQIIVGNAADGRILPMDLYPLLDDLHYFLPYDAVPVVRRVALQRSPALREVLRRLSGVIPIDTMRVLNRRVDVDKRGVADVAREFVARLP
jgi:osmoprotectant transport system substrate-binding protein